MRTSRSSVFGKDAALDWFTFFCADMQTGFGPFIAVYLTAQKWTQTDIGTVLSIASLVGLAFQMPSGLLVDRARSKRGIAGVAVAAMGAAALLTGVGSVYAYILFAWTLHAVATCLLNPAITSMSLDLVGHERIGTRLGRNSTFASIGNALAAAAMGGIASYFSNRAVFFATAALALPALMLLLWLRPSHPPTWMAPRVRSRTASSPNWRSLLTNRQLLVLAVAIGLFTLGNAAMLPLVGSVLTLRVAHSSAALIAACIVVPQIMVAVASPVVGRLAQTWGRRPLLLIGLAALPLRAFCFAFAGDPHLYVAIQALDGVSASVIGVLVPLVAADATRRSGGYALAQGMVGSAMGLGAAFSSTIAGRLTDHFSSTVAFEGLGVIAIAALVTAALFMPEERSPSAERDLRRRERSTRPDLLGSEQPAPKERVTA